MDTIIPKTDEPLRDPGICRGPDNIYYLTGTTPIEGKDGRPDFNNCRGARLWSSEDLRSWKDHGLVWDLWEDVGTDMGRALASWQTELYPVPGLPPGERARGFTAPRLTFAANRFWLSYSMSGQGAGVMLSRSTDAAGPYIDGPQTAEAGGHPAACSDATVFVDTDGTRYLIWGGGVIAELDDPENLNRLYGRIAYEPQSRGVTDERHFLPALADGYFTPANRLLSSAPCPRVLLPVSTSDFERCRTTDMQAPKGARPCSVHRTRTPW